MSTLIQGHDQPCKRCKATACTFEMDKDQIVDQWCSVCKADPNAHKDPCKTNLFSSRACLRGTKGCDELHGLNIGDY